MDPLHRPLTSFDRSLKELLAYDYDDAQINNVFGADAATTMRNLSSTDSDTANQLPEIHDIHRPQIEVTSKEITDVFTQYLLITEL